MESKSNEVTKGTDALNEWQSALNKLPQNKSSSPSKEWSLGSKRSNSAVDDAKLNIHVIITGVTVGGVLVACVVKGLVWDEKVKEYTQHEKRVTSADILKIEITKNNAFMMFQLSPENNGTYIKSFLRKGGLETSENVASLSKEPTNIYTHTHTGVINNKIFTIVEDGETRTTNLRHVVYIAPTKNIDDPDAKKSMGILFEMITEIFNREEFRVNSYGPLKTRKINYNLNFQEVKIDNHLSKPIGIHFLLFSSGARAFIEQQEPNLTPQEDEVVASEVVVPTTPKANAETSQKRTKK
jgi:hypothetical protein